MKPLDISKRLAVACALLTLAACASAPVPTDHMAVGRKAVERASGTPEVVQWAPSELDRARYKIQQAEIALRDKNYDDARRLADEAEADARYAEARAQSAKNQRALAEVREALRGLREEIARRPT